MPETKEETKKEAPKQGTVVSNNDSKLKAALSCFPLIGLIMYFVEKEDKRVRFYAAQGILIGIAGIIITIIPIINFFAWIAELVIIVIVGLKAYQTDEWYKLPLIGDWAMQWAEKKM